jgi:hypothetical protein
MKKDDFKQWTDDKKLKKVKGVKIANTKEIIALIRG